MTDPLSGLINTHAACRLFGMTGMQLREAAQKEGMTVRLTAGGNYFERSELRRLAAKLLAVSIEPDAKARYRSAVDELGGPEPEARS
jgi:hypothetical protein